MTENKYSWLREIFVKVEYDDNLYPPGQVHSIPLTAEAREAIIDKIEAEKAEARLEARIHELNLMDILHSGGATQSYIHTGVLKRIDLFKSKALKKESNNGNL